jgi:transcriptional regulator with XRE-family HTH domain
MIVPQEPQVGARIRSFRAGRGLSLRVLARRSGLSTNAISLIERGENSPTVSSLHRLATALNVPITAFFEDVRDQATIVVRREARLRSGSSGITMESLGIGLSNQSLAPFLVSVEPGDGNADAPSSHPGEELVYVVSGQMDYQVAGETFRLRPGDSLLFEASQPHAMINAGSDPGVVILVFEVPDGGSQTGQQHLGELQEPSLVRRAHAGGRTT